jgi:hypothetical protein
MLVGAGFRSDLTAALKRKDVKAQHGRYLWIAVSRPEQTHATQPQVCSNPLALLPPVTDPDPARVNKEELRTERFRIEEIPLDKIKVRARRRALNQAKVDAIADSMDRMGLQTPITVCKTVNGDSELIVASSGKSMKTSGVPSLPSLNGASIWRPGRKFTNSCTRQRGMLMSVVALAGEIKRPQNLRRFLSLRIPPVRPRFQSARFSNRSIAQSISLLRCAMRAAIFQR